MIAGKRARRSREKERMREREGERECIMVVCNCWTGSGLLEAAKKLAHSDAQAVSGHLRREGLQKVVDAQASGGLGFLWKT